MRYQFVLNYGNRTREEDQPYPYADLAQARDEAIAGLRELAAQALRLQEVLDLVSIKICDEKGQLLEEVSVADAINPIIRC